MSSTRGQMSGLQWSALQRHVQCAASSWNRPSALCQCGWAFDAAWSQPHAMYQRRTIDGYELAVSPSLSIRLQACGGLVPTASFEVVRTLPETDCNRRRCCKSPRHRQKSYTDTSSSHTKLQQDGLLHDAAVHNKDILPPSAAFLYAVQLLHPRHY